MKPILANYYITYQCNARCSFCNIPDGSRPGSHMFARLEDVKENLGQLRGLGVKFIDFTGGEPLLHPQLHNMLREAKNLDFVTSVTTNCLLYPKRAGELAGLVDLLHFSLDPYDSEWHNLISHEKVIKSLDLAKSMGEKPDLLFTITNENYRFLDDMANLAKRRETILIINPVFSYFGNDGHLTKDAISYIESFENSPFVYLNRAFLRLIKAGGNDIEYPRCHAVSSSLVISPDNHLLLPCFHWYTQRIKIDGHLREVWHSRSIREQRRLQGSHSFCRGCTINCYFDPSFLYQFDIYLWDSLLSKARYAIDKYVRTRVSLRQIRWLINLF